MSIRHLGRRTRIPFSWKGGWGGEAWSCVGGVLSAWLMKEGVLHSSSPPASLPDERYWWDALMRFSSFFGRHFLWHSQKKDVSFLLVSFGEGKKKKRENLVLSCGRVILSLNLNIFFFFKVRASFPFRAFRHEKFTLLSSLFFFWCRNHSCS